MTGRSIEVREPHEIIVDRLARRIPEIGRDGEDAVGADLLGVARERERIVDRERADMDGDRNPARHGLDGGLGKKLALGNREVERFRLVVRPRDRRRALADMEIEQPLEGRQVQAVVVLERRDGALHHPAEFVLHVVIP